MIQDYFKFNFDSRPRYCLRDLSVFAENRYVFETDNQYILLTLGFGIGFGSIWRFPYLVYEMGSLSNQRRIVYDSISNTALSCRNSTFLS